MLKALLNAGITAFHFFVFTFLFLPFFHYPIK